MRVSTATEKPTCSEPPTTSCNRSSSRRCSTPSPRSRPGRAGCPTICSATSRRSIPTSPSPICPRRCRTRSSASTRTAFTQLLKEGYAVGPKGEQQRAPRPMDRVPERERRGPAEGHRRGGRPPRESPWWRRPPGRRRAARPGRPVASAQAQGQAEVLAWCPRPGADQLRAGHGRLRRLEVLANTLLERIDIDRLGSRELEVQRAEAYSKRVGQ